MNLKNNMKKKTPQQIAKNILEFFKKNANPEKAKQAQRFFKEPVKLYGFSTQEIRKFEKELYKVIKSYWNINDAIKLCEILLPHAYLEPKGVTIFILSKYSNDFPSELFLKIKNWLSLNYCNNWATVDYLCFLIMYPLLMKYPELIEKLKEWTESPNRWIRRSSAVSLVKFARKGELLEQVYEISQLLFNDKNDLVQKANGWLLREAGKTDMFRLEKFLLKYGTSIPRTTLRYAIERFNKEKRKNILLKTKLS
jgi:3-methyladenine DNA glycosylase AlkD